LSLIKIIVADFAISPASGSTPASAPWVDNFFRKVRALFLVVGLSIQAAASDLPLIVRRIYMVLPFGLMQRMRVVRTRRPSPAEYG